MSTSEIAQLIGLIGSLLAVLGGGVWWCLRLLVQVNHLKEQVQRAHNTRARLTRKLRRAVKGRSREKDRAEDLEKQLEEAKEEPLKEDKDETDRLKSDLETEKDRADRAEKRARELDDQINQVLRQEERIWERPVSGGGFQPLTLRRVPIIAVLNLKGGVGKTTITANLAGLIAQQKK